MKLEINFDREELSRRSNAGKPLTSRIYWLSDDSSYPDAYWSDFGPVLLGLWTARLKELVDGEDSVIFTFMEGPCFISVQKTGDTLTARPHSTDYAWQTNTLELAAELYKAIIKAISVIEECKLDVEKGLMLSRDYLADLSINGVRVLNT